MGCSLSGGVDVMCHFFPCTQHSVMPVFSLLAHNTLHIQLRGRKHYFGSRFQGIQYHCCRPPWWENQDTVISGAKQLS